MFSLCQTSQQESHYVSATVCSVGTMNVFYNMAMNVNVNQCPMAVAAITKVGKHLMNLV